MKKVSELEGAELDYWVARADGFERITEGRFAPSGYAIKVDRPWKAGWEYYARGYDVNQLGVLRYSREWSVGGPIIEREGIELLRAVGSGEEHQWAAKAWRGNTMFLSGVGDGPTPLIAAMRAFVASKYGEEVPQ